MGVFSCSSYHPMEADWSRLGESLVLTEEEDLGVVMPTGIWHSDPENGGFHVVGCVLSHKPYHVAALKTFFHSVDRDRVLASGPWAFEKNLVVIAPVSDIDNPAEVDLAWCDFHVRIHGLPLGKMTPEIASFIGGKIGRLKDFDLSKVNPTPIRRRFGPGSVPGNLALHPSTETRRGTAIFGDFPPITASPGSSVTLPNPAHSPATSTQIELSSSVQEWWRFSGVYGEPDTQKRVHFWALLRQLHFQSSRPWLCAGDFNEILAHSEKEGGPPRAEWQIRNFRDCLSDCDLHDLGFRGPDFTWCNNQLAPYTVRERLDRACSNVAWSQSFPKAYVRRRFPYSDHSLLIVELRPVVNWTLSGSRSLSEKIASVSAKLSGWGRALGRETRDRIQELEQSVLTQKHGVVTADTQSRGLRDKAELTKLIMQEEIFWKQCSKDLWLKEGDRNTGFFHAKASLRHHTNSIRRLRNTDGSWLESAEEVQRCILEYFQGCSHLVIPSQMISGAEQSTSPPWWMKQWRRTCNGPTQNLRLPMGFNDTHIVLIPKCKQPQSLSQYRPISLCNVVYKVASKTIANRLKPWLHRIISPAQSAFVSGRLITDNVLLAFETNHFLNTHSKGSKHFMNLKLDISKAYDRVEWPFLRRVLGKLGFPCVVVDLIMLCVTSVSYSFVLSGHQFGSIIPQRGLRQGDPLSPYLFLLCTESLSALFRMAAERGTIPGVAVCRGAPRISHLLFADDTMVFCPVNVSTIQHVRQVLDQYKIASGQEINLHKSSAAFSRNTPLGTRQHLASILGVRLENKHEVYLGLPAVAFRSKRALFAALKDRIWKRIQGWHEKLLSQAGKAVLIQAVVQAIPSYAMSCFRLPKMLLVEFQSLAANFFWHDGDKRRIHWLAWDHMCRSKLDGGLGFRNLEAFNLALLAKQLWWLLSRPDSLVSKVLKAKYFPRSHLFEAQLGARPSYTWRSIWAAMDSSKLCAHRARSTISALFWPEDRDYILQIPLSFSNVPDLLIWHYSLNGIFSVRSAYHLALSLGSPANSSTGRWDKRMWQVVWQAHIPNKAKVFMWRAIQNILPTANNLVKRLKSESVGCPLCDFVAETPIHTLLHCSFARQVWALSGFRWSLINFMINLWKNGLLVVDFARHYLHAYQSQNTQGLNSKFVQQSYWNLPPAGWIKVNFDGGFRDRGRVMGLGAIARDASGSCLAWLSIRMHRGGTAELAEAFAAREAIRLARRHQWRRVILEGDCSTLLHKLSNALPNFSVASTIIEDVRSVSFLFESLSFSLVLRSANSAADFLAKCALNQVGDSSCFPPGLDALVLGD
ncbi:UNVERIFIED_CONTAM: putative mitochondrial protein [Sesamum radiatum]|uniref:Mitochondrial protein n=1 Tax=Sesamum radiatum TaxID=300843 RepID=A0AAW2S6X7_SESRA